MRLWCSSARSSCSSRVDLGSRQGTNEVYWSPPRLIESKSCRGASRRTLIVLLSLLPRPFRPLYSRRFAGAGDLLKIIGHVFRLRESTARPGNAQPKDRSASSLFVMRKGPRDTRRHAPGSVKSYLPSCLYRKASSEFSSEAHGPHLAPLTRCESRRLLLFDGQDTLRVAILSDVLEGIVRPPLLQWEFIAIMAWKHMGP